ncbi:MAG: hypothetical protein ACK5LC_05470 [Coprobacillaceae bacterium]
MFWKFKKNKLDERQLLIRGSVYFRTLTFISILILMNFFIKQYIGISWVEDDWDYLLITLGGLIMVIIQLLYYDIYPLFNKKYRIFFWGIGIYGIGYSISNLFFNPSISAPLFSNQTLTEKGALTIFFSYYVLIFIVYLVLAHRYKIAEKKSLEE